MMLLQVAKPIPFVAARPWAWPIIAIGLAIITLTLAQVAAGETLSPRVLAATFGAGLEAGLMASGMWSGIVRPIASNLNGGPPC
jgi:hypothetical protein